LILSKDQPPSAFEELLCQSLLYSTASITFKKLSLSTSKSSVASRSGKTSNSNTSNSKDEWSKFSQEAYDRAEASTQLTLESLLVGLSLIAIVAVVSAAEAVVSAAELTHFLVFSYLHNSFEIKDESELIGTWRGEMKDHTSVIRPVANWEIKFLPNGYALPDFRYKIKDGKVELTSLFGKKIIFSKSFGSLVSDPTYEYEPIKLNKID
jgi:hypothetical protein